MVNDAEAQWKKRSNLTSAQERALELQARADPEDLKVNGDFGRDPEEWRRTWRWIQKGWKVKDEQMAWGKEKRAIKSRVVVLVPPLVKTSREDRVEVEWFHSHIDEQGGWEVWVQTWLRLEKWRKSLEEAQVPVKIRYRAVGRGPTWLRQYNEQRRVYQELLYAWYPDASERGPAAYLMAELMLNRDKVEELGSRASMEAIVRGTGKRLSDWEGTRRE